MVQYIECMYWMWWSQLVVLYTCILVVSGYHRISSSPSVIT